MASARPTRIIQPSAKLLSADNGGDIELSFHRKAIATATAKHNISSTSLESVGKTSDQQSCLSTDSHEPSKSTPASIPVSTTTRQSSPQLNLAVTGQSTEDHDDGVIELDDTPLPTINKRFIESESESDSQPAPSLRKKTKRPAKRTKVTADDDFDSDGMHKDVNVQGIEESDNDNDTPKKLNQTQPTADIQHFFQCAPKVPGAKKARVSCLSCKNGIGCPRKEKTLVNDCTTLRRHMAASHPGIYRKWAKTKNFDSMLPEDAKERREAMQSLQQSAVDEHFKPVAPEDKPIAYSDEVFKEAAIEWLIETNQPIQAFEHPKFKKMVDIAARSTRGVKYPTRKQTRQAIIATFKKQMNALKDRLNSAIVTGAVSLTCDAWQASNTDGYFAVTGHWIEEPQEGEWIEEEALFGFALMNTAHNGTRLGQALYRICNRLNIVHKVGHITCDNAANNGTMLDEFARCYTKKTGKVFDVRKRHIRCLAHIINLATQALISTRSKAKYYSPDTDDAHIPDLRATERDEVGLVRAISVKARSSSQRKELFQSIQVENMVKPLQLLLDMKVRWGSTYVMLTRAQSRKENVDMFVYRLSIKEPNNEKRRRIGDLTLSDEEWMRVRLFNNLLEYADDAQHAFSSATRPSLHKALPAIEKLYAQWEKASGKERYMPFHPALHTAMDKLNEYYQRTAASDAHLIAMALNPVEKFEYFRKHWGPDLYQEVVETIKKQFIERYKLLHSEASSATRQVTATHRQKSSQRSRHNIDDTDSESEMEVASADPTKPWLHEWNTYIQTHEIVPEGMGIVRWWGINARRYPTWASWGRDILAIMASSVSSERAFSAAGITIGKRRNRLKGDIVEALQCLKCLIHRNLLFRDVPIASDLEADLETDIVDIDPSDSAEAVAEADNFSWDQILDDEEDGNEGGETVEILD